MPRWTNEQQEAIDKEGTNIIVSAGAGSGKTAVLTERVIRKLKNNIDIDRLLILTFTNAAAKEMKERIRAAIKKDISLERQLDLIEEAYITTFDSYSLSLVKKYYYLLNVSKNIKIIDASVIYCEKSKIIDNIFDDLYEQEDSDFLKLIEDFCIKSDKDIKKYILNINDKLDLLYDKLEYLDNYFDKFYNDEKINHDIELFVNILNSKKKKIDSLVEILANYVESDYIEILMDTLNPIISSDNYESLKLSLNVKMPNIPRNSSEEAKKYKEDISSVIKELKSICIYEDTKEIKEGITSTEVYVRSIIKIVKLLSKKLDDFKKKNNVYEFNDISKMAIRILIENPNICNEIKNNFQEIMVDEYQDTSDLQEKFISLIQNNNVYMVGDIKQSIYRFRNANPYIFKNKYDNYSKGFSGYKIDLNKNFRSRKETLDNINIIFNIIMDDAIGGADYSKSHQMIFGNNMYLEEGKTTQNENFEIYNYKYEKGKNFTRDEIEAFIVASDIKNKINTHYKVFDKEEGILRDSKYSDFVILMDRATKFDLYKKIFEYMNIPLTKYTDTSITDSNDLLIIKNIIGLIIKYYKKEFDLDFRYNFISIARSYLFNYEDSKIFDYLENKNYEDSDIIKIVQEINKDYDNLSIKTLVATIVEKFKFYEKLINVGNVQNSIIRLEYIYNLAGNSEDMDYDIEAFYDYLTKLVEDDFSIKVSISENSLDSVKIMTIHKSKGLEYPICYYTGIYSTFNISDTKDKFIFDNKYGIISPYFKEGINKTIYNYLFKTDYIKEEISEKIRLFYVALTRCREKMILVGEIEDKTLNSNEARLNYKSFLDILNSVYKEIEEYIVDVDLNKVELSKDYNLIKDINYDELIKKTDKKVVVRKLEIENNLIEEKKFSKDSPSLFFNSTRKKMQLGTKIHYYLECLDFNNPDFTKIDKEYHNYINNFLHTNLDFSSCSIYKEYEFMYNDGYNSGHGIIDLMLVYDDEIKIIDYKLNNIIDEAYINQLNSYKEYIKTRTNKEVKTYLYSIFSGKLEEINKN